MISIAVLLANFRSRCAWCGAICETDLPDTHPRRATRDHIVPRARGGSTSKNLALACYRCNQQRHASTGPPPAARPDFAPELSDAHRWAWGVIRGQPEEMPAPERALVVKIDAGRRRAGRLRRSRVGAAPRL